ncbi:MAG: Crp/Fnr family transcriptional regulator [Chitinophagaceae bacterium]
MDVTQLFFHYLNKFVHISDEEFEQYFTPILKVRRYGKKEYLIKAGEVEDFFSFVIKGLVRKFYKKGHHEINTQISTEGQIIMSQQSFLGRQPSEYYIETIEPSVIVSIRYAHLEELYNKSKKMERLGRLVVTHMMAVSDSWQMQLIKMSPRERFLNFVMKNPELMQRVPQKYLASYLNIKPETFSRFKHLLRNHSKNSTG